MNEQAFKTGDRVWFWEPGTASYPRNSNTFKGIVLDPCVATAKNQDGDPVKYCKVQDSTGEQYTVNSLCVTFDDPRKSFEDSMEPGRVKSYPKNTNK